MQSQGFAPFVCPTSDQFRAEVAWPGDWPEAQAGEAPAEAPSDAEEARMDEELRIYSVSWEGVEPRDQGISRFIFSFIYFHCIGFINNSSL